MTLPPTGYINDAGEPTGSDIDIGEAIADLMGVTAQYDQTGWDGLIASVQGKKCDAINSNMFVTSEREKVLDFVAYGQFGEGLLVEAGNPPGITTVTDLAGMRIGVSIGTTGQEWLIATSEDLVSQGRDPIDIVEFPQETESVNSLRTGRLDGAWIVTTQIGFYAAEAPDEVASWGPESHNNTDAGIAVREGDTALYNAITAAIDHLYESGKMCEILQAWKLEATALADRPC